MKKRVAVRSLGCKLNTHEGELMQASLRAHFDIVPWSARADYYILNTCSVTARADARCRNYARNAKRRNPEAKVLVTGCYAQTRPEDLERMPEVDLVFGNAEKERVAGLMDQIESGEPLDRVAVSNIWKARTLEVPVLTSYANHSRPFIKIQDGCNEICSFCKIPLARGRNRSSLPDRIVEQVRTFVRSGYGEVVFTGVHMGCYGEDLDPKSSLRAMLEAVLALEGRFRIRLSSIESNHLTDDLIDYLAGEPRVCRHIHVPLQSGDDDVLARMRRRYLTAGYRAKIERLASVCPGICLGADVIVGFPGETDAHFENTAQFIEDLPLAYLHVFPYSRRDHTPAATMPDQVPEEVKSHRGLVLRALSAKKWTAYVKAHVGRALEAIVLSLDEGGHADETVAVAVDGRLRTLTDNYIDVYIPDAGAALQSGRAVTVIPGAVCGEVTTGTLADPAGA